MTEVYEVEIGKKKLAAMPVDERRLLLLLGHAANEINVLQKLILVSGQATPELRLVDLVQAGQTFILMRTLIGKLHEAWELFKDRFLDDHNLRDKYLPKLDPKAKHALDRLNKHFGKQSPLTLIRNNFSFHYKDENNSVENSFQEIPNDEVWHFYLSNLKGNSFYYASELVVARGVIKLAEPAEVAEKHFLERSARGFERLCRLTVSVAGHITILFDDCITAIVSEHLGDAHLADPVEIVGAAALKDIDLPFFIDDSEFAPSDD